MQRSPTGWCCHYLGGTNAASTLTSWGASSYILAAKKSQNNCHQKWVASTQCFCWNECLCFHPSSSPSPSPIYWPQRTHSLWCRLICCPSCPLMILVQSSFAIITFHCFSPLLITGLSFVLSAALSAAPSWPNTLKSGLIVGCFLFWRWYLLRRGGGVGDEFIVVIIITIFITPLNFYGIVTWIMESISRETK